MRREHGQLVRADLVRRVAVRRDPVGAGEDAVDLAGRHHRAGRRVGDHGEGNPLRLELPGGEAHTLEQRPGLVDQNPLQQAPLPRRAERAERGAIPAGRQAARVAVRQRPGPGLEERRGVRAHAPAALDLVPVDLASAVGERFRLLGRGPHLGQRPGEIDRRRSRRCQDAHRVVEVLPTLGRERVRVRGRDADRRCATDRQRPDRVRDLARRRADQLDLLVGQPPLVEQHDLPGFEPHDPLWLQHGSNPTPVLSGDRRVPAASRRRRPGRRCALSAPLPRPESRTIPPGYRP